MNYYGYFEYCTYFRMYSEVGSYEHMSGGCDSRAAGGKDCTGMGGNGDGW